MNTYRARVWSAAAASALSGRRTRLHPSPTPARSRSVHRPSSRLAPAAATNICSSFGQMWDVDALYLDYREMFAREKLDIVCVATHPGLHRDIVEAAVDAGAKGILCEKPLALSLEDGGRNRRRLPRFRLRPFSQPLPPLEPGLHQGQRDARRRRHRRPDLDVRHLPGRQALPGLELPMKKAPSSTMPSTPSTSFASTPAT